MALKVKNNTETELPVLYHEHKQNVRSQTGVKCVDGVAPKRFARTKQVCKQLLGFPTNVYYCLPLFKRPRTLVEEGEG